MDYREFSMEGLTQRSGDLAVAGGQGAVIYNGSRRCVGCSYAVVCYKSNIA